MRIGSTLLTVFGAGLVTVGDLAIHRVATGDSTFTPIGGLGVPVAIVFGTCLIGMGLFYDELMVKKVEPVVTQPFSLSELEYKREEKFQDAHYKKHKTDHRRIIQYPTGIGNKVEVECMICHKKEDISDYESW